MRPQLFLALIAASLASAQPRVASIYLQPVTSQEAPPTLLAELSYDTTDPTTSEIASYDAPELPEDAKLVRIGIFDPATKQWQSSVSVASVDNFAKGYSPHFVLSVDTHGQYLGASVRGVRIDAGQTRDFGPQAVVVVGAQGKQPELNKPVVLSPEGKKVEVEEKTFLQKYWWVLLAITFFALSSGGGEGGK
ncbi:hypothetical protein GQ53DRAFT_261845 [Thozetella sp. PMI_491]|nr:hypothetical protein GQ53DRAFT_261845 [Thozetella sp. PMI_491]